ncbi:MAG TPA: carboxypeptidase regulatory-like domain-containing protein, partial [Kofleriaceae bacterium]|nr:carboxypeptidase regulatory-like domain-containing protein [Kofleriaceae bacterium]
GRFDLGGLAAGRYRLQLAGAGVFTAEVRFVPVPTDELRLVLARRVAIVGRVLDGGAGSPNVVVAVDGDAIGEVRTTVTANDGTFGFADLPEGTYRVWGGKEDLTARAQAAPRLGRGPFPDVALYLEPATIVVGKVVDRETGAGLEAAVMLTPQGDDAGDPDDPADTDEAPRFARTDATGVFRVEGVPNGRWTADAWAPGWIAAGQSDFAAGRANPTIELVPGGVVEGKVVDGTGRPVAGVSVSALSASGGHEVSEAAADEQLRRFSGRSLRTLAGYTGAASASAAGGTASAPAVADDAGFLARGELGVMLGPIPYPPAVAGSGLVRTAAIVEDTTGAGAGAGPGSGSGSGSGSAAGAGSGAPAARIGVSPSAVAPIDVDPAYQPTWTTGDDGAFRLVGVPAGTWIAYGLAPAHPPARSRRLTLRLGQTVAGVELRLVDGVFVAGRVTDQRGEPVAGALLAFAPAGDASADDDVVSGAPGALQAVTDGDGRYRAGPLVGPTTVKASAFGHADRVDRLDLPAAASDGAPDVVHDVVLVVADAELNGIVQDATGLPVVGARVEVEGGPADGRAAAAGAGGRFTIAMLPPDALTVRVEAGGYPVQRFPVTPGTPATLTLAYGGGIEAVVFDHHTGDNLEGIAVAATGPGGLERDLVTDAQGHLTLVPVPAGRWTLRARTPGYLARSITVDVPAGDRPGQATVRDVRLELERGALVGGTVRDRHGDRVSGARVTITRGDDEVSATTDALGEYRLRDAPTGTVVLEASKAGATARMTLELRAGDERLTLDVELH